MRLLLVALVAAAAFPLSASADPVACVHVVPDGAGVPVSYCPPVEDVGVTAHCQVLRFRTPLVPDVYVCSTVL